MTVSVTLSLGAAVLMIFSLVLFVVVTVVQRHMGMFDGADSLGIGGLFSLLFYVLFWALPSVLAWAVWATWLR